MKSVSRGLLALLFASAILLVTDLRNLSHRKESGSVADLAKSGAGTAVRFRIGMVHYVDSPNSEECEKGIRQALEDQKLIEGVDFSLKVFNAQGDISTLNSIAGSIGNEAWDLVFTTSTPTVQMLARKLPDIRMVFTNVGDPMAAGLGKSFEDHLPGLTGISTMSDFEGMIRMVRVLHPGISRLGTVFTPAEINSVSYKEHLHQAAESQGITLIAMPANTATEVLEAAKSLASQHIGAFCQISDNLTSSSSSAILKVSSDSKIPFYGFISHQLNQGAVAVCARDYLQAGYEAGMMGFDVLSGKNPAEIPFRFVSKRDYLIRPENAGKYKIDLHNRIFREIPELVIDSK